MAFAALEAALSGSVVMLSDRILVLLPLVQGGADIGVLKELDEMLGAVPFKASEDTRVVVLRYDALGVVMAFRLRVVSAVELRPGAEVAAIGVWNTVVVLIVASGHAAGSIGTALEMTMCFTGAVVWSSAVGLEGVYNDTCVTVMVIFD